MKIYNIIKGIILIGLLSLQACINDQGNYDYLTKNEILPVEIGNLKDTTVKILSVLDIKPELTGLTDTSKYTFLWYTIPAVAGGNIPQRDTLAQTLNLKVSLTYEPGSYNLFFEIRDKQTDVYVNTQAQLNIVSIFAHGWYVLKDENNRTDFYFIDADGVVSPDILQTLGRTPLMGKGVKLVYQPRSYSHQIEGDDGKITTLRNKKALYVVSDQDLNVLNADDMACFKTFGEVFYESPAVCKPQNFYFGLMDSFLINAGRISAIWGAGPNIGKFAYEKTGDYELSGELLGRSQGVMIWDKKSRTFFYTTAMGTTLNHFKQVGGKVSPERMNADLLCLLPRSVAGSSTGYALMKNPGKEEFYLVDIKFETTDQYPFVDFDTIPGNCALPKAEVRAAHQVASCIYFAKGSELWVYKDVRLPNRETKLESFPGETIRFISHIRSTNRQDVFNQLIVVTDKDGGWKLYRYDLIGETPEIEKPVSIEPYCGRGTVRDVIFRI